MANQNESLQKSQLKSTSARVAVLSYLGNAKFPVAADDILDHVLSEHEKVDRATIYRMLETFYEKGLIRKLQFGEGKARFELVGEDHHHLICELCGRIEDISDCNISELEKEIKHKKNFLVKRHSLEFFGVCASCQH